MFTTNPTDGTRHTEDTASFIARNRVWTKRQMHVSSKRITTGKDTMMALDQGTPHESIVMNTTYRPAANPGGTNEFYLRISDKTGAWLDSSALVPQRKLWQGYGSSSIIMADSYTEYGGNHNIGIPMNVETANWHVGTGKQMYVQAKFVGIGANRSTVEYRGFFNSDNGTAMHMLGVAMLATGIDKIANVGVRVSGSNVENGNIFARYW